MKFLKILLEKFLRKIDMFGLNIHFKYKHKKRLSWNIGKIFSLIIISLILFSIINFSNKIYNYGYSNTLEEKIISNNTSINLMYNSKKDNYLNYSFGFRQTNETNSVLITLDQSYVSFEIKLISKFSSSSPLEKNLYYSPCYSNPKYFCISNDYILQGIPYYDPLFSFIKIDLNICVNGTKNESNSLVNQNSIMCKSMEMIENYIETLQFEYLYSDFNYEFAENNRKIIQSTKIKTWSILSNTHVNVSVGLVNHQLNDMRGMQPIIFPFQQNIINSIFYDKFQYKVENFQNTYFTLIIYSHPYSITVELWGENLLSFLSKIGGMIFFFVPVGYILTYYITSRLTSQEIMNQINYFISPEETGFFVKFKNFISKRYNELFIKNILFLVRDAEDTDTDQQGNRKFETKSPTKNFERRNSCNSMVKRNSFSTEKDIKHHHQISKFKFDEGILGNVNSTFKSDEEENKENDANSGKGALSSSRNFIQSEETDRKEYISKNIVLEEEKQDPAKIEMTELKRRPTHCSPERKKYSMMNVRENKRNEKSKKKGDNDKSKGFETSIKNEILQTNASLLNEGKEKIEEKNSPKVINIDRNKRNSSKPHNLIEILPNQKKNELDTYFKFTTIEETYSVFQAERKKTLKSVILKYNLNTDELLREDKKQNQIQIKTKEIAHKAFSRNDPNRSSIATIKKAKVNLDEIINQELKTKKMKIGELDENIVNNLRKFSLQSKKNESNKTQYHIIDYFQEILEANKKKINFPRFLLSKLVYNIGKIKIYSGFYLNSFELLKMALCKYCVKRKNISLKKLKKKDSGFNNYIDLLDQKYDLFKFGDEKLLNILDIRNLLQSSKQLKDFKQIYFDHIQSSIFNFFHNNLITNTKKIQDLNSLLDENHERQFSFNLGKKDNFIKKINAIFEQIISSTSELSEIDKRILIEIGISLPDLYELERSKKKNDTKKITIDEEIIGTFNSPLSDQYFPYQDVMRVFLDQEDEARKKRRFSRHKTKKVESRISSINDQNKSFG